MFNAASPRCLVRMIKGSWSTCHKVQEYNYNSLGAQSVGRPSVKSGVKIDCLAHDVPGASTSHRFRSASASAGIRSTEVFSITWVWRCWARCVSASRIVEFLGVGGVAADTCGRDLEIYDWAEVLAVASCRHEVDNESCKERVCMRRWDLCMILYDSTHTGKSSNMSSRVDCLR